ncbi:hypothetical protein Q5530_07280 [Saccharothrix sp. BKS2]
MLDEPPPGPVTAMTGDGVVMVVPLSSGGYRLVGIAPEDVRTDSPGS